LQQFGYAWRLYLEENNDQFPPNKGDSGGTSSIGTGLRNDAWISGWLSTKPNFPANTNIFFLRRSLLAPFLKENIAVWRCPGDKSRCLIDARSYPRVRSVSMNNYLNTHDERGVPSRFKVNTRISDLIKPSPSETWVFTDEREDSIEDNLFVVDMENGPAGLASIPGSYHNRAGNFSFADGHAQRRKWLDPRTVPRIRPGEFVEVFMTVSPPNPDVIWLQERTTGLQ
jgi:prepilin-type processing-associated H-X9-DG protein